MNQYNLKSTTTRNKNLIKPKPKIDRRPMIKNPINTLHRSKLALVSTYRNYKFSVINFVFFYLLYIIRSITFKVIFLAPCSFQAITENLREKQTVSK